MSPLKSGLLLPRNVSSCIENTRLPHMQKIHAVKIFEEFFLVICICVKIRHFRKYVPQKIKKFTECMGLAAEKLIVVAKSLQK